MTIRSKYFGNSDTPNTVSRNLPSDEHGYVSVVGQSGKPLPDADLNLIQDVPASASQTIYSRTIPSGFLRTQSRISTFGDFTFSGPVNAFSMTKKVAMVDGVPVTIEYTNTTTPGTNVIQLGAASVAAGGGTIKRTDFVFLEVWRALVAPSPRASGTITISGTVNVGDTVTFNTTALGGDVHALTAVSGAPAANQFQIGGSSSLTASNLATSINTNLGTYLIANPNGGSAGTLVVRSQTPGTVGNGVTITSSTASIVINSTGVGPLNLTGGANRINKPDQSHIYRHGNTLSPSGVWLTDDMVDPVGVFESTQRVQMQYRIRVYSSTSTGINPKTQPDGFSNTAVLAQGAKGAPVTGYPFVPADGASTSSSSNAANYGIIDAGLWIAGDGSSGAATALDTLDGFVYAIPVSFVLRRNDASTTGGFDPDNNANGGLSSTHALFSNTHLHYASGAVSIGANLSDRPDGYFHDTLEPTDIVDLRRHVTIGNFDLASELQYQIQSLMDGTNLTWQIDGSDKQDLGNGSGEQSTQPLFCDEIGRLTGTPSAGSGDTRRGVSIRNFDHVARRFGSQPVVERIVFNIPPTGSLPTGISITRSGGGSTWHVGDVVSIDFGTLVGSSLADWTSPGSFASTVSALWPSGTTITDVLSVTHDDGLQAGGASNTAQLTNITGTGTAHITVTLDSNTTSVDGGTGSGAHPMVSSGASDNGSTRNLRVELEVTYPAGVGLTNNVNIIPSPNSTIYPQGSLIENNPTQRPTDMSPTWVPEPQFRLGFREVGLEQVTAPSGSAVTETVVATDAHTLVMSRRISSIVSVTEGMTGQTVDNTNTILGSSSRTITLSSTLSHPCSVVTVVYYPQDPISNAGATGYQVAVYYRSNGPQTVGVKQAPFDTASSGGAVPTQLNLEVLTLGNAVMSGQIGAGSVDSAFPYVSPLAQIPCANNRRDGGPITFSGDWWFTGNAPISVSDVNVQTGLLNLFPFVTVDGTTTLELGSSSAGQGPILDADFRGYYDYIPAGQYRPTVIAQPLSGLARHKVFFPVLARATADSLLYRKGEVLLVVFSRFAQFDGANFITFTDVLNTTSAAVYRTRNLLLTTR